MQLAIDSGTDVFDHPRFAMDNKLFVQFFMLAVRNEIKSIEAGRPIFDDKEYVRIITPGNTKSVLEVPVQEEHRSRFASRYERWKKGQGEALTGTPLEMWPQMTVSQVAELKALNIHTVEQLASLSDGNAQQIMGNNSLRAKAKLFLDAAAGEAVNTKMTAELEKRDDEIALLRKQVQALVDAQAKKSAAKE
jgi:hypothetical protein